MKNGNFRTTKYILRWILLGLMCGGFYSCTASEAENEGERDRAENLRPVRAVRLKSPPQGIRRVFPGKAGAAREVKLAFRVGGPLVELNLSVGEHVAVGDVIGRIDPRDFKVRIRRLNAAIGEANAGLKAMGRARVEDVEALKARLSAARARLNEATLHYERFKNLYEEKATAKSNFDHARAGYDMALAGADAAEQELQKARKGARSEDVEAMRARIDGLKAELKAARNALSDAVLRAPFSGYVNHQFVENFEHVRPGQPIASLLDFSSVEVHVGVPEEIVVREGGFETFTCEFEAYPGRRFEATLKEIGKKTDPSNQTYPLTVVLHAPDSVVIRPGMAASVAVTLASPESRGLAVPVEAVVNEGENRSFVWIFDEASSSVKRRPVVLGGLTSDGVEVVEGLAPGEHLVTAGVHYLMEGQKVRLLAPASSTNIGGRL